MKRPRTLILEQQTENDEDEEDDQFTVNSSDSGNGSEVRSFESIVTARERSSFGECDVTGGEVSWQLSGCVVVFLCVK